MIGALGRHVLGAALETLAGLRRALLVSDDVWVSVNVSPRHLDDPGLPGPAWGSISTTSAPGTRR